MVDQVLPPKRDVALKLLETSSLFIHLDPRRENVSVPAWFKKQAQLVLQVGLAMAVPIHDLEVGENGISCTLSFSRQPHWCFMPWSAVFALVGDDGRGMVWPDDVPAEVARQSDLRGPAPKPTARKRAPELATLDDAEAEHAKDEAPKPASPPRLSLIPGGAAAEPAAAKPVDEPAVIEPVPAPVVAPAAVLAPERQLVLFDGEASSSTPSAASEGTAGPSDDAPTSPPQRRERPAWLRVVKGGAEES
jgi:stringent starvation protein B